MLNLKQRPIAKHLLQRRSPSFISRYVANSRSPFLGLPCFLLSASSLHLFLHLPWWVSIEGKQKLGEKLQKEPYLKRRRSAQPQAATNRRASSSATIPLVHLQVCRELAISLSSSPMLPPLGFISSSFSPSSMVFSIFHGSRQTQHWGWSLSWQSVSLPSSSIFFYF